MGRCVFVAAVASLLLLTSGARQLMDLQALALTQRYALLREPKHAQGISCQTRLWCRSELAWRRQGRWQNLCRQAPPPADPAWRPRRFYRLQWRCGPEPDAFILLSWTILR